MPEVYLERIVAAVLASKEKADVDVLAQASMAKAAVQLAEVQTPVLASPRLGVKAAIEAYDRLS